MKFFNKYSLAEIVYPIDKTQSSAFEAFLNRNELKWKGLTLEPKVLQQVESIPSNNYPLSRVLDEMGSGSQQGRDLIMQWMLHPEIYPKTGDDNDLRSIYLVKTPQALVKSTLLQPGVHKAKLNLLQNDLTEMESIFSLDLSAIRNDYESDDIFSSEDEVEITQYFLKYPNSKARIILTLSANMEIFQYFLDGLKDHNVKVLGRKYDQMTIDVRAGKFNHPNDTEGSILISGYPKDLLKVILEMKRVENGTFQLGHGKSYLLNWGLIGPLHRLLVWKNTQYARKMGVIQKNETLLDWHSRILKKIRQ